MNPEKLCETFARNLRAARKRAGLSQRALAIKLATGHPVIANWEKGTSSPTLTTVAKIAAALEIPPEALLTEIGEEMLSGIPA